MGRGLAQLLRRPRPAEGVAHAAVRVALRAAPARVDGVARGRADEGPREVRRVRYAVSCKNGLDLVGQPEDRRQQERERHAARRRRAQ